MEFYNSKKEARKQKRKEVLKKVKKHAWLIWLGLFVLAGVLIKINSEYTMDDYRDQLPMVGNNVAAQVNIYPEVATHTPSTTDISTTVSSVTTSSSTTTQTTTTTTTTSKVVTTTTRTTTTTKAATTAVQEVKEVYTEAVSQQEGMTLIGNLRITGYVDTGNRTASGEYPYVGGVAMNRGYGLPYGTKIYIEGLGTYTLNDTGCRYGVVDVFCNTEAECYALTSYANVYVIN